MEGDLRRARPSKALIKAMLDAAYPELTNGTAWIAPTTPTATMEDAHFQAHADAKTVFAEVSEIWAAMRDAYLQDQPKDKAG